MKFGIFPNQILLKIADQFFEFTDESDNQYLQIKLTIITKLKSLNLF